MNECRNEWKWNKGFKTAVSCPQTNGDASVTMFTSYALYGFSITVNKFVFPFTTEEQYGQKTRTIQVDFTDSQRIYPAIAKQLEGLEIGILGNGTTNDREQEKY